MEVAKPQLLFFNDRLVQYSIVSTNELQFRPINSLDNSSIIQFQDNGNSEDYRDLSSAYISLKVKMIHRDDSAKELTAPLTAANLEIACINNFLHSMFRQVTLSLNGKQISQNNTNYAYR